MLGLRLDCWRDGVSALGVRYLHMFEHGGTFDGRLSFPTVAIGLGVDGGMINVSSTQDSDKGAVVDGVLRGAVHFPAGWISGELTAGMATGPGEGPIQVGSAGIFWGLYVVDIGYSYAFPFAPAHRPEWLPGGMFSVRLQLPLDAFGSNQAGPAESARAR
jgi:hypothetical protein